jgi:hypothetical protein
MTGDTRPPVHTPLDDESIGLLVRGVADGWTMPAVRLDAPSWRERVRGRRARLLDRARVGLGRAARAATMAVALTVVATLAAVVITRPPQQPAGSPNPTGAATNAPSGVPAATVLPKLQLNAELPFPSRILVANEMGDIALVDLGLGTIGGSIARAQWPSSMTVTANGVVVCICITTGAFVNGYPTHFDVRLRTFTRATTPIRDVPIDLLVGTPDRRVPATVADHVWTSVSFSPDGRYAFVGWSTQDNLVWHSGLLIVDIEAGSIAGRRPFPDMTAGEGDARRTVGAPRVLGGADDGNLILARSWAEWGSANVETEPIAVGDDGYAATFADGRLSDLAPIDEAADCGPSLERAGALPGSGFWLACVSNQGTYTVRRIAGDGSVLGSESITRTGFVDGDTTAVSADGRVFYFWDPGSSTLTRIDLSSGDRVNQRLAASTAAIDPMTAVGRWLAPAADAKSMLRGAILVAPDGSRLYVLATQPVVDPRAPGGSNGILVVDAATLQVLDRWPPTADLVSMALNSDGTLLYATGLPGVDASGKSSVAQGASVTVYDTSTGAELLIAGQLGIGMLSFPGPVVP